MEPIKLKDIIKAAGGEFFGSKSLLDEYVEQISTNSTDIKGNSLFIPLIGDRFDAHDFIDGAFENGCMCALSQKKLDRDNYVLVSDTLAALRDIAEYYRGLFDIKVIAVTGSVGKTAVKELLYAVLSQKYNVLKNIGNFNNEIGLPKTLFNLNKNHEIAVVEMGMNSLGEISRLSKTARPDVCIITNIGDAHIGRLGSRESIFEAKTEIFDYMKEDGQVFLYGDDDMLVSLNESDLNPVFFGESSYNHVNVKSINHMDIKGIEFTANAKGEEMDIRVNAPGKHMLPSVLCAVAVGQNLGLNSDEIRQGVLTYIPEKMRNEIIEIDKITIIDDCYNSCEESIIAGIEILELAKGRKTAILGDIREVGEHGKRLHYSVGTNVAKHDVDVVICCGEQSLHTYEGLKDAGKEQIYYYENKDEMFKELGEIIEQDDTVYVKASRGCAFEKVVEYLKKL